jgi:DNA repair protein RadC
MKKSTNNFQSITSNENIFLSNIAEVKISYSTKLKSSERKTITNSRDAYEIFQLIWDFGTIEYVESVKLMLLNRANKVLGIAAISTGGISGSVIDPKVIFQFALKANASGIIIAHNHPSCNLKPSEQDISITRKIKDGSKLLDISLLDHLIISANDGFYSMADEGVL